MTLEEAEDRSWPFDWYTIKAVTNLLYADQRRHAERGSPDFEAWVRDLYWWGDTLQAKLNGLI